MMRICSKKFALAMIALLACGVCECAPGQTSGSARDTFFNILSYGAHRDGSASSTDAFRLAIEAAHKAGGGTVYVPPGNYVNGPLPMESNLTLFFLAGAVPRFPLIGGHGLENVAVIARGGLTTNNADWMRLRSRTLRSAARPGSANGAN